MGCPLPEKGPQGQVRLEQAFVKGRMAELEEQKGETNVEEIWRVKEETWRDMNDAMRLLGDLDRAKHEEYLDRVAEWERRLRGFFSPWVANSIGLLPLNLLQMGSLPGNGEEITVGAIQCGTTTAPIGPRVSINPLSSKVTCRFHV